MAPIKGSEAAQGLREGGLTAVCCDTTPCAPPDSPELPEGTKNAGGAEEADGDAE